MSKTQKKKKKDNLQGREGEGIPVAESTKSFVMLSDGSRIEHFFCCCIVLLFMAKIKG